MKWHESLGRRAGLIIALVVGIAIGAAVRRNTRQEVDLGDEVVGVETHEHEHGERDPLYACPMLCVPPSEEPGKCPVCGMNLEPVNDSGEGLSLSERTRKLARIEETVVERREVNAEIRLSGKIVLDESRVAKVTARVSGRADRLFADYTGMTVKQGDHLVSLYSPDLLAAQQELIQAKRSGDDTGAVAARDKLRLWGMTSDQVSRIEQQQESQEHLTIYSPIAGVIIGKDVVEGKYLKTGEPMYTIADLSHVWAQLDAYESDISMIKYGQKVSLSVESRPGKEFHGLVTFVAPTLDERTRTVKVRVNVSNKDGALKPGTLVRGTVKPTLSADGGAQGPDLDGKWICPMHPEVIEDESGKCRICEMDLVPADRLAGASNSSMSQELPLVIPATAPLVTGKRAVVYVYTEGDSDDSDGRYVGREVVLGPRAGDYYIVHEGLREGEIVVSNGAFKIDSQLQILGKPSMMVPEGGAPAQTHHGSHGAAGEEVPPQVTLQDTCPIMGNPVNREVYVDHAGYRVYFCCPGCDTTFKADPDKYVADMLKSGVKLARTPFDVHKGAGHE